MSAAKIQYVKMTLVAASLFSSISAGAAVVVPGTSDMWLAGMPDGAASSGDIAPTHSPVLVSGINLNDDAVFFTSVTGKVSNSSGCPNSGTCVTADGSPNNWWQHSPGAVNGISNINAPINSLLGVFLTDSAPNTSNAPVALDFQQSGLDFTYLAPELQQVFFIGDGKTSLGDLQTFYVPDGATRLYLGTMDGYGWYDNSGQFSVEAASEVPLPPAALLLLSGMASLIGVGRRKAKVGRLA